MKLLLFFVDGLGLGAVDKANPALRLLDGIASCPFAAESAPAEFAEGMLLALDATGGIPGRPQSATGQTSLMTGVNAPALLGGHLTALPNRALAEIVEELGLMKALADGGVAVTASNLNTKEFFDRRERLAAKRGRNMLPVSSLAIRASGAPFRGPEDYGRGRALFADLTNRFLKERGWDMALIDPGEAARRMAGILKRADFVFHEYFVTDTYAHKGRGEDVERALGEINLFLKTLREITDPEEEAILLLSDHGNCEDSGSADHNRNPVPLLLLTTSETARAAFAGISRLEEVKNGVLAFFGLEPDFPGSEEGALCL